MVVGTQLSLTCTEPLPSGAMSEMSRPVQLFCVYHVAAGFVCWLKAVAPVLPGQGSPPSPAPAKSVSTQASSSPRPSAWTIMYVGRVPERSVGRASGLDTSPSQNPSTHGTSRQSASELQDGVTSVCMTNMPGAGIRWSKPDPADQK